MPRCDRAGSDGSSGMFRKILPPRGDIVFHQRYLLRHLLVHHVQLRDGDREMDEDEQNEKDTDQEEERRRVGDPRRVGDSDQPVLLDRQDQDDHAAGQPQDRILLPQFPTPYHLQYVEKESGGGTDRKNRYPVHPNLRMRLMR